MFELEPSSCPEKSRHIATSDTEQLREVRNAAQPHEHQRGIITLKAWKEEIKWYFDSNHLKDLNRFDGESMEFEWKIFPGFTTFGLLEQIQEFMTERQCDPEQFEGKIIFMSMINGIVWGGKRKCQGM